MRKLITSKRRALKIAFDCNRLHGQCMVAPTRRMCQGALFLPVNSQEYSQCD